jgi:OmpA-OmpF porin, OOP family
MKKISLLLMGALLTLNLFAQNADKKWAIGLGAGLYDALRHETIGGTDKNVIRGTNFSPELYLSRFLSPSFDVYLKENLGFKKINGSMGTDLSNTALNLRYKFANDKLMSAASKIQPYIFAGPAYLQDNEEKGLDFNAGLGSKFAIGDNTALYLEGGYMNGLKDAFTKYYPHGVKDNLFKLTAGLEFALGKAKDTDGDGVVDKKDKCPDTPAGVAVDVNGCPLDKDGDGIPDYKDECPDIAGLASLNGCPDKDGDGIADAKDECPDAAGLKKFNGCPDTDGDGIPDAKDECPASAKGCAVDAKGCPLDTDKDGVIDCEDKCPTVAGEKENKGCPVIKCKDFDVSPVYFDFDKSKLRPEGIALLDKFVTDLGDCKNYEIVVNGHTCSIGSTKYNQGLSERRSQEVVKYLLAKGVNNAYIGAKGYGETQPAVPNTNEANRAKNRRAEIDLTVK